MTTERVDLDGLRMMIQNPHAYPIVMLTQGLEYCIAELENARTTIEEDAIYMRRVEGFHQWFEDTYLHSGHIATLWTAYLRSGEVV